MVAPNIPQIPYDPYPAVPQQPPSPFTGAPGVPGDYQYPQPTPTTEPGVDPWAGMSEYEKMQSDYQRYAQESGIWGTERDKPGPQKSQDPAAWYAAQGGIPTLGGGGVGGVGGVGGAGGPTSALLEYGQGLAAEPYLPGMIDLARREQTAIQAGAEQVPLGREGYMVPLMEQGLRRQIEAPGMSPAEYTQAKRRITQGYQAQTGAVAQGLGKSGFWSQESAAQAAGGQPAQQLGMGMAELLAKNAEIQRKEREAGIRTAASIYGPTTKRAFGAREAMLAQTGQYRKQTPVQRQGIYNTQPSSTAPETYSSWQSPSSGGGGMYVG